MDEKNKRKNDEVVKGTEFYLTLFCMTVGFLVIMALAPLTCMFLIAAPAMAYWTQQPVHVVYVWAGIFLAIIGAILYMILRGSLYIERINKQSHSKL